VGLLLRSLVILLALAAQTSPPTQRFKSSVDVVQVDVSAIDSKGRPIRDLMADDFELRVDGRPRSIVSVQFVSVPSASDSPAPSTPAPPAQYASNAEAVGGRLIMIVIDRTSIATGRGRGAIEAARQFLGRLNRADRVALASIPTGPQVNFTADHTLVQKQLQKIDGTAQPSLGTRNIGIYDALAFERRDDRGMQSAIERECGQLSEGGRGGGGSDMLICSNEVRSEATAVASDARERARNSIRGLQDLIDSFPPSQTPKLLIYISEGLVVDRELSQLSWLEAKAAAAHVTVYSLHLESSQYDASQKRPQAQYSADRSLQEQGLSFIAQATRGDMFRVMSNSDFAFQRLSLELSGYYLLGFEAAPEDRNGKPHNINVTVRRDGVTVRSRRQFAINQTPTRTAESEIVATLRDPLPATEIPIKVTTYSFRDPHHEKLRLLIAAEIDRSINADGQMSVGYVIVDFDGKLVASQLDSVVPTTTRREGNIDRYLSAVALDAGKYSLKLAASDDVPRRGSVETVVHAGLTPAGPIRSTDLLIADGAGRVGDLPLFPAVTGDITGTTLHSYLELFADAPETLEKASVTLEIAESDKASALERIPVQLATTKESTRCRIAGARVNIGRFPPGTYVARAVIAVGLDEVGQVSRTFRITRASARTDPK
jgi:VWFA-related protein